MANKDNLKKHEPRGKPRPDPTLIFKLSDWLQISNIQSERFKNERSIDVSNYTLGILQTYHWVYYRRICTIIKKVLFVKGLKALLILRVS